MKQDITIVNSYGKNVQIQISWSRFSKKKNCQTKHFFKNNPYTSKHRKSYTKYYRVSPRFEIYYFHFFQLVIVWLLKLFINLYYPLNDTKKYLCKNITRYFRKNKGLFITTFFGTLFFIKLWKYMSICFSFRASKHGAN